MFDVRKKISACLFFIILFLSFSIVFVNCQQSEPNYIVSVHIEKSETWKSEQITVRYIITGLGSFDYGHIAFYSDVENIHQNSYVFTQAKYTEDGLQIIDTIDNSIMEDSMIANWNILTSYIENNDHETHVMTGAFNIDTANLKRGNYKIKVVLSAKHNGINYVYSDSTEYRIISLWDMLWTPLNVLSLIITLFGLYSLRVIRTIEKTLEDKELRDIASGVV